jgi:hypothetical protein
MEFVDQPNRYTFPISGCRISAPFRANEKKMFGDITNPRWLWIKFGLFVFLGLFAFALALLLHPDIVLAALIAIAIWAFSRAYYFIFYVIEHYIDPSYRFAGLIDFLKYALRRKKT